MICHPVMSTPPYSGLLSGLEDKDLDLDGSGHDTDICVYGDPQDFATAVQSNCINDETCGKVADLFEVSKYGYSC